MRLGAGCGGTGGEVTSCLQTALAIRRVDLLRLGDFLRRPDDISVGVVRLRGAWVDFSRLQAIYRGSMPNDAEAEALAGALDFPARFFQQPPPAEMTGLFVCKAKQSPRCACGRVATLLCDEPSPPNGLATCDRLLCAACAVRIGDGDHRCRDHASVTS